MKYRVTLTAIMDGVGPIGPKDEVFLLVKRMSTTGDVMSREQYKADDVQSFTVHDYKDLKIKSKPLENGPEIDSEV